MLKSSSTSVTLCELVEHPGGRQGGQFPQDHTYGVNSDGHVYYATDVPFCTNDTFADASPADYALVHTREEALAVLRTALLEAEAHHYALKVLVAKFAEPVPFTTYFGDEDEEEDEEG